MSRVISDEQMYQITDALIGQCAADQDDVCESLELPLTSEWSQADHALFDEQCFKCERCGWWFEIGELGDDPDELVCMACVEEE